MSQPDQPPKKYIQIEEVLKNFDKELQAYIDQQRQGWREEADTYRKVLSEIGVILWNHPGVFPELLPKFASAIRELKEKAEQHEPPEQA